MSIFKFQEKEAKVILHVLDLGIQSGQVDKYAIDKTQEIISNFTRFAAIEGYNLKEKDRSWVMGCIETGLIYPNIDLINMSDYDVLTSDANTINKIEELIEIINIRDKLLLKKDLKDSFYKKCKEFLARLDNISKLRNIQKILYTDIGYEQKMAILLNNNTGIKYRDFDNPLTSFKFEKIIKSDYLVSVEPKIFASKYFDNSCRAIDQVKVIINKYCG